MVEFRRLTSIEQLREIQGAWDKLAAPSVFQSSTWLFPWWQAYSRVLNAQLEVQAGFQEDELVAVAPFYVRVNSVSGIRVRELRMMGDAGPRPASFDLLCQKGKESTVASALAKQVCALDTWDILDLQPLRDPSSVRAHFVSRLGANGLVSVAHKAGGQGRRMSVDFAGSEENVPFEVGELAIVSQGDGFQKGLQTLRRLSRLEWAERDEPSPWADREAFQLISEVVAKLAPLGCVRYVRLNNSNGVAIASLLSIDEHNRQVIFALAVDPEYLDGEHAVRRLLRAEAVKAKERGLEFIELVTGAQLYSLDWMTTPQRAMRLVIYRRGVTGSILKVVKVLRKRVGAAVDIPHGAAAGARSAWTRIRSAAAQVAGYQRYQLFRGDLWTQEIRSEPNLQLRLLSLSIYESMDERERAELIEGIQLAPDELESRLSRGDLAMTAQLNGRISGIAWCAISPLHVPELERTIELRASQAYVYGVFVNPAARGRKIAPALLAQVAKVLRRKDVYRAWALIDVENIAARRAFQRATFAAVCDVIVAKVATKDRIVLRPPDAEAKELLGL